LTLALTDRGVLNGMCRLGLGDGLGTCRTGVVTS
jgi:hypothetical protein